MGFLLITRRSLKDPITMNPVKYTVLFHDERVGAIGPRVLLVPDPCLGLSLVQIPSRAVGASA